MRPLQFFLGGHDLEMLEIARLARASGCRVADKQLLWGARLSDYAPEIELCHQQGRIPIAVELADDMPQTWPPRARLITIDHHNASVAKSSALEQVFKLLQLPNGQWTRHLMLVAVNDVAHIDGLVEMGASADEILAIRTADRAAQAITPEQEREAERALCQAQVLNQRLTLVHLPHGRMAPVTDALALNPAFRHLPKDCLVAAPLELGFFGEGRVVLALADRFPGGWWGGNLPKKGFWGLHGEHLPLKAVSDFCLKNLLDFDMFSKDPGK